jgi:hypothetical protein
MTSDKSPRTPLTRRQLAFRFAAVPLAARAASAFAQSAPAQPQPAVASPSPVDPRAKAQDDVRKNSDRLRQIELDTDLEPAFVFHP